jgi:AraC family transcriptional regulator
MTDKNSGLADQEPSFLRAGTMEAALAAAPRRPYAHSQPPRGVAAPTIDDVTRKTLYVSDCIAPVVDSRALGWSDVFAARTSELPHNTQYGVTSTFWVSMSLDDSFVQRRLDGKDEEGEVARHSIYIVSPGTNKSIQLGRQTDLLHVFVNPALIDEVASEIAQKTMRNVLLNPLFNKTDAELGYLLRAIKRSLAETDNASPLKMDYLSRALCADLLEKYALEPVERGDFRPMLEGLSRRQIALMQDYLESNLAQDVRISDLASLCGVSVTAFSSRFKASKGMTPYQYLIQVRLEKGKQLLAEGKLPISEIAIACGFTDQAHFTKVFGQRTGFRPSEYRKMC